MFNNIFAIDLL